MGGALSSGAMIPPGSRRATWTAIAGTSATAPGRRAYQAGSLQGTPPPTAGDLPPPDGRPPLRGGPRGGLPGSLTQLKVFVQPVRPRPEPEPLIRFETEPGHQAQVDFADVRLP
jgi:hypothetical protein